MRFKLAIFFCLLSAACANKFIAVKPENLSKYFERIKAHNQRILQVKASLDIKALGLMGNFLHEEADIVVRAPHFMYWSLRSFFHMPSLIVASNGEFLTAYDFSGQNEAPYQILPLRGDTFFEVMDFRLHPQSVIYLLTQEIPLERAHNILLSTKDQTLVVSALLENLWSMQAIFDLNTDQLLSYELKNEALKIHYSARYLNYRVIEGILFPSSLVLLIKGKSRSAKLDIEFTHTELNGQLVSPDVFYVKPH